MGWVKEAKTESFTKRAGAAYAESRTVFVAQIRGPVSHSASLSRPIPDAAEMIEAVEEQGWRLDQFTGTVYKDNTTLICVFRRRA